MNKSEFSFHLPEHLIAQQPLERRSASRLLCLSRFSGETSHATFAELTELLRPDDLLVFNNTRVIPARLFGQKPTGGKVEILVERMLDDRRCLAQLRVSKKPAEDTVLTLEGGSEIRVIARQESFFILEAVGCSLAELLETSGHMPLPPYIQRQDTPADRERYQTVFASQAGAVAAPTAGLHFDNDLLEGIRQKGVRSAEVTLHVGAGTFQPVRSDDIEDHHMHSEYLEVSADVCDAVRQTRERGGRVIAVGTTSVRSLETAAQGGQLAPYRGDSNIFIYPGYEFQVIDGLITNFHLPESTLLMLVSAFAGLEPVLAAYREAVEHQYRFFSYGDAMLLL